MEHAFRRMSSLPDSPPSGVSSCSIKFSFTFIFLKCPAVYGSLSIYCFLSSIHLNPTKPCKTQLPDQRYHTRVIRDYDQQIRPVKLWPIGCNILMRVVTNEGESRFTSIPSCKITLAPLSNPNPGPVEPNPRQPRHCLAQKITLD